MNRDRFCHVADISGVQDDTRPALWKDHSGGVGERFEHGPQNSEIQNKDYSFASNAHLASAVQWRSRPPVPTVGISCSNSLAPRQTLLFSNDIKIDDPVRHMSDAGFVVYVECSAN